MPSEANGVEQFMDPSSTNIAHELTYRNLNLYRQLEKDLLALEDFANYAWEFGRLGVGKQGIENCQRVKFTKLVILLPNW